MTIISSTLEMPLREWEPPAERPAISNRESGLRDSATRRSHRSRSFSWSKLTKTRTRSMDTSGALRAARLRFAHLDAAAVHRGSVEGTDRIAGRVGLGHLHEREAARAARLAVGDHADRVDGAVPFEHG